MEKHKNKLISTFSAQITATISVSLVLFILGVLAFLIIGVSNVTRELKENMGFSLVMTDNASDRAINALINEFDTAQYVSSYKYFSAEDALKQWEADTGEDLMAIVDINPFCGEFQVNVKEQYASSKSLGEITRRIESMSGVDRTETPVDMVNTINDNINSVSFVLILISGALLVVSFVLINNTVRLTIYSRRFTIHTMKLVGATSGFIRRPFIINNIIHGIIAAVIASGLLSVMLHNIHSMEFSIDRYISWGSAWCVFGGVLVCGIAICALASLFATNKYIRLSYDEMFK